MKMTHLYTTPRGINFLRPARLLKTLLVVALPAVTLLVSVCVFPLSSALATKALLPPDYAIEQFNINIDVMNNHDLNVTETITISGIEQYERVIRPFSREGWHSNKYEKISDAKPENQADGNYIKSRDEKYFFKLTDYNVQGATLEEEKEDSEDVSGEWVLRRDDGKTSGEWTFNITYKIEFIEVAKTNHDFLKVNAICAGWDVPIRAANITINFPKPIDGTKAHVTAFSNASEDGLANLGIFETELDDETNTNIVTTATELEQGAGIAYIFRMDKGYFEGQTSILWVQDLVQLSSAVLIIVIFLMWIFMKRRDKHIETVEFYPPNGYSPAEVGYAVDGVADTGDVIAQLMWFASLGYLKIEETKVLDEKGNFLGKNYIFYKLNDLPEDSHDQFKPYDKTIFEGLFSSGDTVDFLKIAPEFKGVTKQAQKELKKEFNVDSSRRVFAKGPRVMGTLAIYAMPLVLVIAGFFCASRTGIWTLVTSAVMLPIYVACCIGYEGMRKSQHTIRGKNKIGRTIFLFCFLTFYCFGVIGFAVYADLGGDVLSVILLTSLGLMACLYNGAALVRTEYGREILGKITGYRNFLDKVEIDKMNLLIEEDPQYFIKTLPYAYVLGLSQAWIGEMSSIAVGVPEWYENMQRIEEFSARKQKKASKDA